MEEYEINFVELESGNVPFNKFLDSLSKKEKAYVMAFIEEYRLMKSNKQELPHTMSKHLRDGIFELRIKFENRITRLLYFYFIGKKIIFTHGFIKKTEKTPNEEIEKAKKYRKIYLQDK
ncbi:MAG: type II toxin-antitoxin system RelE/ParE family toxin [Bacteroidetes bacterium]|nr:MAG: type II toxin-antitoxin system RelE/ParE family toxin [Bacteroidota bacterium]